MDLAVLSKKGQVSVEFILIVVIALIYIVGSVWPSALMGARAAEDVKAIADAKLSSMKIANALNEASVSGGDMKKTISLFLGANSEISCDLANDRIAYSVVVDYVNAASNPDPLNCIVEPPTGTPVGWKCQSGVNLNAGLSGFTCPTIKTGPSNSLFRSLVVEKKTGNVSVSWA